jgi:hypothetical protein
LRNAHLMEELPQYWPSKFFAHFGNWCQWGRSFEGLRELVYVGGFVLKHYGLYLDWVWLRVQPWVLTEGGSII